MANSSSHVDFLGRAVHIPNEPQRIVSLCPSQTELLFDLGLGERIVGRTRWCIHPKEQIDKIESVGGTKNPDPDKIRLLKPDLILCEKEENTAQFVTLMEKEFPVYVTDVRNILSAMRMILIVGELTGKQKEALELSVAISTALHQVEHPGRQIKVAYLIWKKPWMAVGADTYINSVLSHLGFENVFSSHTSRYPEFSEAELAALDPDMVFLSSEPFPFSEKHIADLNLLLPGTPVRLVDGEMFSWYGSRMLKACSYFKEWVKTLP